MPYQLHCEPLLAQLLAELATDEPGVLDLDDELTGGVDELLELGAEDAGVPPQILPVTAGVSAAPLVFTCIPNETVWPGWILPFQLKLVAE